MELQFIHDYRKAVKEGPELAFKFLKEMSGLVSTFSKESQYELELNIKTNYMRIYISDSIKILDDLIKIVNKSPEKYHTSDSALVYNFLSIYIYEDRSELDNEKFKIVENFLLSKCNRFTFYYIMSKSTYLLSKKYKSPDLVSDEEIENLVNLLVNFYYKVIENSSKYENELFGTAYTQDASDRKDAPDFELKVIEKFLNRIGAKYVYS